MTKNTINNLLLKIKSLLKHVALTRKTGVLTIKDKDGNTIVTFNDDNTVDFADDINMISGKILTAETLQAVDTDGFTINDKDGNVIATFNDGNTIYLGGSTNYTEIKSDGEINLHGAARVKKCNSIKVEGFKAPASNPADKEDLGITYTWAFSDTTQEYIVSEIIISNDMDRSEAPTILFHWSANDTGTDVVWQLEYLWRSEDEDMTAAAEETLTVTGTSSTTADGLVETELTGIDAPSSTDDFMLLRVSRDTGDAADTLSGDAHLSDVQLCYTANKLGTATDSELLNNLISYWKFDGDATDSHGSNDGTVTGASTDNSGIINQCYSFDGVDDDINCGNDSSLNMGTEDFTIAIWFKANADLFTTQQCRIIAKGAAIRYEINAIPGDNEIAFSIDDDISKSNVNFDASASGKAGDLDDGNWHLLIAQRKYSDYVRIRVDNSTWTQVADGTGNIDNTGDFEVGKGTYGDVWDGELDEAGIWKKILTEDECSEIWNSSNGLTYPFS